MFLGDEQVTLAQQNMDNGSVTFLAMGEDGLIIDENGPVQFEMTFDEVRHLNEVMIDADNDEFTLIADDIDHFEYEQQMLVQQGMDHTASISIKPV